MRILFDWTYVPDGDPLFGAQVIIGMAFGANQKGRNEPPGVSNEAIARVIYELWTARKLPVVVQREVAEALLTLSIPIRPDLIVAEDDHQFHITSQDVLSRAWEYCDQRSLHVAVIVAHPAHILRCRAVAEKVGFMVQLPKVMSVPYEPRSKQWWTRNRYLFFLWELFARIGWRMKDYL